jgi:undecaprenyl diphosphate synthase
MSLLVETLRKEIETLTKNNIKLNAIGDLEKLPKRTLKALLEGIEVTKKHDRMTLTLALNYSSRWEITHAARGIATDVISGQVQVEEINEGILQKYLATEDMPDPELMIRTSGEQRISNFLLWQSAYTELYFTDIFWPEFRKDHFYRALIEYQRRERRFGKISEQIAPS